MEIEESKIKKAPRKRTKGVIKAIQSQLHFYFGNANLRHDQFLRKEIESHADGYLDVSILLKFNKLKSICDNVKLIKKALQFSDQFELDDHGEKFRLKKPLPPLENTDKKTIYVEQLHAYCDHDWLMQVFSICGKVAYISLPRYNNGKIKGFAFIEFSSEEEAERACKTLNTAAPRKKSKKSRQSSSEIKCEAELPAGKKDTPTEPLNPEKNKRIRSNSMSSDTKSNESKSTRKRRRSSSISIDGSPLKVKLTKLIDISKKAALMFPDKTSNKETADSFSDNIDSVETKDVSNSDNSKTCETVVNKDSNTSSKSASTKDVSLENPKGVVEQECSVMKSTPVSLNELENRDKENIEIKKEKKKNRQHKKKKDGAVKEISVPPLYVISKNEWITLKRQYKNLQKREMQEMKKTCKVLKSELVRRKELKENLQKIRGSKNEQDEKTLESTKKQKLDKGISSKNIEYTETPMEKNHEDKRSKGLEILPGTVLSLSTSSEALTKSDIKSNIQKHGEVTYVDYLNGSLKGHVRFPNKDIAEKMMKISHSLFTLNILSENEEQDYMKKAQEDREKKYARNQKGKSRKKKRGGEKIVSQLTSLQSHVRFNDEENEDEKKYEKEDGIEKSES